MQPDPYILLVDDDSIAHFLTRRALSDLQFDGEIIEAFDGVDACECINRRGSPVMLLLDLRMPRMDGHEFLGVMSSGELGDPPLVYVVTSSSRPEDKQLEDDFPFVKACIEKPIDKNQVSHFASSLM